MTGEMQGVAEGLVKIIQKKNLHERIEWNCCLSNPLEEGKHSGKLASSHQNICTPGQVGESCVSTWKYLAQTDGIELAPG